MNTSNQFNRRFVIQNIVALFSGSAISQGLTAIIFLVIARQLGAYVYGTFTASLALTSITALIFNLGLDLWLLQAAGKNPEHISKFTGSVLAIKIFFSFIWFVLLLVIQPHLDPDTFPPHIVFWTAIIVWLDSLFMTTLTAFNAVLQNRYPVILEPASDLFWLFGTLILISLNTGDLVTYLELRVVVLVVSLVVAIIIFWSRFKIRIFKTNMHTAIRETPPYAFSALMATTTMRIDILIVALFLGSQASGIYSPALSMVNALFFIPSAVSNVIVPVLSRLFVENHQQARKTSFNQLLLQTGIGVVLGILFIVLAPIVVRFLGESYENSLQLMYILSLVLLQKPITFAFASILVASGNQTKRVIVQFFAAIINIIFDVIAVLFFDLIAVAVVYVLIELILVSGYGVLARQVIINSSTVASVDI